MTVAEHLLELEHLLDSVPPCSPEGVISFRLDHPGGRAFFSVCLGSDGHRVVPLPMVHPHQQLSITGQLDDWLELFKRPYAQKLGKLRFWGSTPLLVKLLAPKTKKRTFLDVRCSKAAW
jgi:hypothetical protein